MGPQEPILSSEEAAQPGAARDRSRDRHADDSASVEVSPSLSLGRHAAPPPQGGRRPPLGPAQAVALQRSAGNRAFGVLLGRPRAAQRQSPPAPSTLARAAAPGGPVRAVLQRRGLLRAGAEARAGGVRGRAVPIQRVTTYAVGPRKRALDEGMARIAGEHPEAVAFMAELSKLGDGAFTYLNQRYELPPAPAPAQVQQPQAPAPPPTPRDVARGNLDRMALSKPALKAYFVALGKLLGLIAPDADGGDSVTTLFTLLSRCSNVQKGVATFLLGADAAGVALDNLPSLQGPGAQAVADKFKNGPVKEKMGALGKVRQGILKPSNKGAFPIPTKDALLLFSSGTDHVFTIVKLGAVYTLYQGNVNLFTIASGSGNRAIANFQQFLDDIADADTAKQIPWFGQDLGSPLFTYQIVKLKSGVFAYLFG